MVHLQLEQSLGGFSVVSSKKCITMNPLTCKPPLSNSNQSNIHFSISFCLIVAFYKEINELDINISLIRCYEYITIDPIIITPLVTTFFGDVNKLWLKQG
jgi:hypothetical protein